MQSACKVETLQGLVWEDERGYNRGPHYGVKIFLFGRFAVERDGQVLPPQVWKNTKTKALLKILASERGRVFPADELIEYLWPDADLRSAASNLRNRVAELRRILEPSLSRGEQSRYILTQRGGYLLSDESDCWVDSEEFSRCEERGRRAHSEGNFVEAIRAFEQALALYRGEYLAEDRYEEWALQIRERFRERFVEILSLLADSLARQGQYRAALGYLERAVTESPLDERLYRHLMVYAFCAGERARARQTYERCRAVLECELGERPSSQTEEIYRQIQSERVPDWERFYPREVGLPVAIRRLPFVGRAREWEQLLMALSRVRAGAGQIVLIFGEAGVGKTRLAEEFARWACEHEQALALYGRCYELENSMPWQLWGEVLRQGISHLHRADLTGVPSAWLAELSELLPELARVIPELSLVALPPEHRQYRLFETISHILKALAARHAPLVLFLDDLQWADSSSLDFLCYLIERIASEPVLIIGAARLEEPSPGVERVRHHGVRSGRLSEMTLGRLGEREISQLVQSLEVETTADFGGRLYRASLGNPLFATAVLHALFENGAFVAEGTRWRLSDPSRIELAPSAVQLLERRVKRASAAAQRVLQMVACAVQIELEVLEAAWEGAAEELFTHLTELTAQGVVVEREGRYEFVHDKFREVVYRSIEGPQRTWLHRRLAQAIQRVYTDPSAAGLAEPLAQHYEQGGHLKQALAWFLAAIAEHRRRFQLEEGLRCIERAVRVVQRLAGRLSERERRAQEFDLILERLDLRLACGQLHAAQEDCEWLLVLAEGLDLTRKAKAFHWKAQWLVGAGRYEEARRWTQQALKLHPLDPLVRANLLSQLGLIAFCRGEYEAALHSYQHALEIFCLHSPMKAAYAWNDCANALLKLGQYQQALAHYQRALELYQELQDMQKVSAVLNNIGATLRYLGKYQEAQEYLERACALDRAHGNRRGLGYSLCNLAQTSRMLGAPQRALELSQEAFAIFCELEDPLGQCLLHRWLGVSYRDLGHREMALHHLRCALERAQALRADAEEGACLVELAQTVPDAHEALPLLERALALIEQHRWHGEIGIRAFYLAYQIFEALHQPERARDALNRAHEELRKTAEHITDPELRSSFLEIPLHRQILAAVDSPP